MQLLLQSDNNNTVEFSVESLDTYDVWTAQYYLIYGQMLTSKQKILIRGILKEQWQLQTCEPNAVGA